MHDDISLLTGDFYRLFRSLFDLFTSIISEGTRAFDLLTPSRFWPPRTGHEERKSGARSQKQDGGNK